MDDSAEHEVVPFTARRGPRFIPEETLATMTTIDLLQILTVRRPAAMAAFDGFLRQLLRQIPVDELPDNLLNR